MFIHSPSEILSSTMFHLLVKPIKIFISFAVLFNLYFSFLFAFFLEIPTSAYVLCVCMFMCSSCPALVTSMDRARLLCPSPIPRVCSNPCLLSHCHHPIMSLLVHSPAFACCLFYPSEPQHIHHKQQISGLITLWF